jgi:ubiquinone/menaquinone biosynthesis C-methylase UbiE
MNRDHRQFFERAAPHWNDAVGEKTTSTLTRIIQAANIQIGDRILDIGTGTGILLPMLRQAVGEKHKIIALDLAFNMVRRAYRRFGHLCNCVQGDAHLLPLKNCSFDKVMCFSSFPHFTDRTRALTEISRCLKSRGRVIIGHSAGRDAVNRVHREIGGAVEGDTLPEEKKMLVLMTKAGFVDVSILEEDDIYLVLGMKRDADSPS